MSDPWIAPENTPASPAPDDVVQAGFLRRWAALFVDQLVLGAAYYAVAFVLIIIVGVSGSFDALERIDPDNPPTWVVFAYLGFSALYWVAAGLYFGLMESSRHQATLGKMALGIKVVDRDGRRLSFPHALGRWFAAILSYLTLYIGFLMAAFTQKKQALHDVVAGTFVVDRWAYTEHPERQQRGLGGCLLAFLIAMILMIALMVVAILAAIAIPAYQQYVHRAQFHNVDAQLAPLRADVAQFADREERCPENGADGFGTPESYAGPGISRIVLGEFEDGYCGISLWLPPARGSVERQFLVEYDPDDDLWYCTDKAGIENLPAWCH